MWIYWLELGGDGDPCGASKPFRPSLWFTLGLLQMSASRLAYWAGVCGFTRRRHRTRKNATAIRVRTAIPPTTPPTIGPTLDLWDSCVFESSGGSGSEVPVLIGDDAVELIFEQKWSGLSDFSKRSYSLRYYRRTSYCKIYHWVESINCAKLTPWNHHFEWRSTPWWAVPRFPWCLSKGDEGVVL